MIAVDTNILVYAHREDSPFFETVYRRLESLACTSMGWAIPWPCLHEFLAITTHPKIYDPPTPLQRALEQVDAWLEAPTLMLLSESDPHWPALRSLSVAGKITGPRVHGARIAALCQQFKIRELWSADRDFSRFSDLKVSNPLTTNR